LPTNVRIVSGAATVSSDAAEMRMDETYSSAPHTLDLPYADACRGTLMIAAIK